MDQESDDDRGFRVCLADEFGGDEATDDGADAEDSEDESGGDGVVSEDVLQVESQQEHE